MSFFWGRLLGLSLVACSNASPRPDIPHGYTLVKSTDLSQSTTHDEIGFYASPTTPGASATFVPKYDATVISGKTLPFVTTTDDAGAPATWVGDWNTDSAGSSTLVPVQMCSEVAQPLEGRSNLIMRRGLVCSEVPASTSGPVQSPIPNSPTLTSSTSTNTAGIPTSSEQSSLTASPSQTSTQQSTSSRPSPSTPSNASPTSPTKSPLSSSSVQSFTTEDSSESSTQDSTSTAEPISTASSSSPIISSTTPKPSPHAASPTHSSSSGTESPESSSSGKTNSEVSSTQPTTASTESTGVSTTGTGTGSTGSMTEGHSITQSSTKDNRVTSTMSSEPSGYSASTVTNSDWTEDFVLTTTVGGQETEVPVLVDCGDECGDDGSIILFGVPVKTGIQYSLPKLPSFHFPCIFNCGSGGGGGEPGAPEQSEPDKDDDDDDDDQSSTSTDDKTATSEATTSSSSCTSVMTASDCIVSCPATESCSKSCFSTVTGCDVTGTTSTTTGDVCSFTNSDYRCVDTTASTQTTGVDEVVTYTSVNYDTARAESIEKAQKTQPTVLPWATGSASPSPTATASTASKTSGSTSLTAVPTPSYSTPSTFATLTASSSPAPSTPSTSINTGCEVTTTVVSTADAPETQTYCQCGNVIAGIGTTTATSGTMLVGCQLSDWVMMSTIEPTTTAPTTTSLDPSPTESASCFPTHGDSDSDKILEVAQPDGGAWCSDPDKTFVDKGSDHSMDPAGNNYIKAGWTLADDAPEECQHFDEDASKSLCADPLNQIVSDCPWNGGSIKNVCGEFWMQTCTLGKTCDVGDPE